MRAERVEQVDEIGNRSDMIVSRPERVATALQRRQREGAHLIVFYQILRVVVLTRRTRARRRDTQWQGRMRNELRGMQQRRKRRSGVMKCDGRTDEAEIDVQDARGECSTPQPARPVYRGEPICNARIPSA